MRDYLNCLSQKITTTLFIYYRLVYSSCSNIICLRGRHIQKSFIMSEVKVGFCTVFSYVTFAMLIGIQCTWVYVYIRVELLNSYIISSCLHRLATDDEIIPFPNDELTPPVTNMYFVFDT